MCLQTWVAVFSTLYFIAFCLEEWGASHSTGQRSALSACLTSAAAWSPWWNLKTRSCWLHRADYTFNLWPCLFSTASPHDQHVFQALHSRLMQLTKQLLCHFSALLLVVKQTLEPFKNILGRSWGIFFLVPCFGTGIGWWGYEWLIFFDWG